jgi:hypothetical protein
MEKELDLNIKSAIMWQLQHIVKNSTSAKFANLAMQEIDKVSSVVELSHFKSLVGLMHV